MKNLPLIVSAAALGLGACASSPESISTEHKGKTLIVHHRSIVGNKARDRIEAINSKGVVSSATIEVFDIGRLPRPDGGMDEAHRYYRVAESPYWDLNLPTKSSTTSRGPRTAFTPPNYSPPPASQRIDDAVAEAKEAAQKLKQAREDVQKRLASDNNLRGELQDQIDANQKLQDQINAGFNTPSHKPTAPESDAQKAAEGATNELAKWGAQQQGNQP